MRIAPAASALAFVAAALSGGLVAAAGLSGQPTAAEKPFVASATSDLTSRFPTPADAERAGYERYTDEDDTGAISYANQHWTSTNASTPSQLWYSAGGKLLGADYSEPQADGVPHMFGIEPSRWDTFHLHDHYVISKPDGSTVYGAVGPKKIASVGGDPSAPTAADLVKAGVVKSASQVKSVFAFPAIYDLEVWLVPNPNGAFAEKNPLVKPSAGTNGMSM